MVYNIQNHWVSGLCPLSGILKARQHNVLETRSVSFLKLGEGDIYSVGTLRKRSSKSLYNPDLVSKAMRFLVPRIPDDAQSPET
jgi:hypothetical protein